MEIEISKNFFLKKIEKLGKVIDNNIYLSSLKGILFKVDENNIQVTSSNGNLSIRETISTDDLIKIINPGEFLVPGKLFIEVLKRSGNQVNIRKNKGSVLISSLNNETKINLLESSEYPKISFDSFDSKKFIINPVLFKKMINDVSFAAAENDKRVVLNGINLKSSNSTLEVSATNSFRLAHEHTKINNDLEFNLTIYTKDLKNFVPPEAKEEMQICVEDSKIMTSFGNTRTSVQLIDGFYPDVKTFIPSGFSREIKINKRVLDDLINQVMVMSTDANKVVVLKVNEEQLELKVEKNQVGLTIARTKQMEYKGEEFEITFNIQFLRDAINHFEQELSLFFNGNQEPFVVKSDSNKNLVQLVLPHRVY